MPKKVKITFDYLVKGNDSIEIIGKVWIGGKIAVIWKYDERYEEVAIELVNTVRRIRP